MSCSSRESTPEVPIPKGAGWAERWEQQLCSFGRATPFAKGWRWKISPDHPWSHVSRQEGEPSRPRDTSLLPWHLPWEHPLGSWCQLSPGAMALLLLLSGTGHQGHDTARAGAGASWAGGSLEPSTAGVGSNATKQ